MKPIYSLNEFRAGLKTLVSAVADNDVPSFLQVKQLLERIRYVSARVHSLTNIDIATGGLLVVDGFQTVDGDRVLLVGQTDATENGLYVASAGAWSRAADMATGSTVVAHAEVTVRESSDGKVHVYMLNATSSITVDTDDADWRIDHDLSSVDAGDIAYDSTGNTVITGATDVASAIDAVDAAIVVITNHVDALTGVSGDDLDTFTGSTISDNVSIKVALQELETALESIDVTGQIQTYYDSMRAEVANFTVPAGGFYNVPHNLGVLHPSGITIWATVGGEDKLLTDSFDIHTVDVNTIQLENDSAWDATGVTLIARV